MLTRDKILFKLKKAEITQQVYPLSSDLSEDVIFLFIYSSCFLYHSILEMQLSFSNVGQGTKRTKIPRTTKPRKLQKVLKTIKPPDAAEVSLRLHFSTFSGPSLSHPIRINLWAPRSSSTFLQTRSLSSSPTEDQTSEVFFSMAGLPNATRFILWADRCGNRN